jgi:hypothetical protein
VAFNRAGAFEPRKKPTRRAGAVPDTSAAPGSMAKIAVFVAPTRRATIVDPLDGVSAVNDADVDTATLPVRPAASGWAGVMMLSEVPLAEAAFRPKPSFTLTGASLDRIGTASDFIDVGIRLVCAVEEMTIRSNPPIGVVAARLSSTTVTSWPRPSSRARSGWSAAAGPVPEEINATPPSAGGGGGGGSPSPGFGQAVLHPTGHPVQSAGGVSVLPAATTIASACIVMGTWSARSVPV